MLYYLLSQYFYEEYWTTIILVITCLLVNVIQTNGISHVIAKIIRSIEKKDEEESSTFFNYLIFLSVIYSIFYYIYKVYQNKLLTKLRQWIRFQLTKMLLLKNNESLSEINFIKMNSPINRMSSISFMISSDFITFLLPLILFLVVVSVFFLYKYPIIGAGFILGNLLICLYLYLVWMEMIDKNEEYEERAVESESYLLEILNNIDKIIYRGQTGNEISHFEKMTKNTIEKAYDFYSDVNFHGTMMNIIVYLIIFAVIGYSIELYYAGKMKGVLFITIITIIILYRDKMATIIQQVPDFVEFLGRSNSVMKYFVDMKIDHDEKYQDVDLPFNEIVFENVSFKYKSNDSLLFDGWNATIPLDKKIIGITGISGKGKSTFAKLALKMYEYEGNIYIDGVNVRDINADYIRKNMVYVNQNAKLFDKKIVDNMMYGCHDPTFCETHLKDVLSNYPKIQKLYENMDIYTKQAGSLGEQLSGGQRQVINIIGGLIHPASIVILDEPTNALDGELKKEVLGLIRNFSEHKKCILIITHDKDIYPMFQSKIEI